MKLIQIHFLINELIAQNISWFPDGISVKNGGQQWHPKFPMFCYSGGACLAKSSQKCFLQPWFQIFKDGKKQKVTVFEQCSEVYKTHSCICSHLIVLTTPSPHCIDALAQEPRVSANCLRPSFGSRVEPQRQGRFLPPGLVIFSKHECDCFELELGFYMQTTL